MRKSTSNIPTPSEIAAKRRRGLEPTAEPYIAKIVEAIEKFQGDIWYSSEIPFAITVPPELRAIVRSKFSDRGWDVSCGTDHVRVSLERPLPDSSEGNRG